MAQKPKSPQTDGTSETSVENAVADQGQHLDADAVANVLKAQAQAEDAVAKAIAGMATS